MLPLRRLDARRFPSDEIIGALARSEAWCRIEITRELLDCLFMICVRLGGGRFPWQIHTDLLWRVGAERRCPLQFCEHVSRLRRASQGDTSTAGTRTPSRSKVYSS